MHEMTPATQSNILKAHTASGIPASQYQVPYKRIGDLLTTQVEIHNEKTWLIFHSDTAGRTEYTYREFYELVCKTANFLLSQGIACGDRIATVAYNHADTVVQYFAAWLIGAVVVPINVGEDDKRIGYILQNSEAKLAFVREEFIQRIEKILAETPSVKTIVRVGGNPDPSSRHPDLHSHIS